MTTGTLALVMPPWTTVICRSIVAAGAPEAASLVTGGGGVTAASGSVTHAGCSGARPATGVTSTALARSPAPFCRLPLVATAGLAVSLAATVATRQPAFVETICRAIKPADVDTTLGQVNPSKLPPASSPM